MKTHLLITTALMLATAAKAQTGGVVVTSAPTLELGQSELSAKLTQILNEAQLQNEKLQTSLERMGEPGSINLASVQIIRDDVIAAATTLKTKDEQRTMLGALTGAEVFADDAFGLMPPIGATVTRKDGTAVNRDPQKYRLEAAVMAQFKEFKEVREKALVRKKALNDEVSQVVQEIQDATDLASIHKLNAMLTVLRGQIEECNQTILVAQADADMTQKELTTQAQIIAKGKQEEAQHMNKTGNPDAPPTPAGTPTPIPFGGVAPGGTARPFIPNLTWGRRNPADNGGSGGANPDAAGGDAN